MWDLDTEKSKNLLNMEKRSEGGKIFQAYMLQD
ncbi:hypothetical protein QG37_06800 [Candidozyma auris]|nr:hypothetical protein QG37_06800 [[Candida] auris]